MPAEDGTDDIIDGEEYPDGKIELFPQFESHREIILLFTPEARMPLSQRMLSVQSYQWRN